MAEESLEDVPLPELFRQGEAAVAAAEALPASAPEAREAVQAGIRLLRLAARLVERAGLFSANEDKDDIATGDLRYLLVPFYLGELLSQLNPGDPAVRRGALGAAREQYLSFLHRARQYDLLGSAALGLLRQAEAGESGEGADGGAGGGGGGGRVDPALLRENKILKFKREREIKARLEELLRQRGGSSGGGGSGGGWDVEDGVWGPGGGGEEFEAEREAWLLQIDLAGLKAAESTGLLAREMEVLGHAASLPASELEREPPPPPPELRQQLLAAAGALQGAQRERVRAGVFRPSHTLPTMSVEQWGELEARAARERQAAEEAARAAEAAARAGQRSDDEEAEAEAVRKQREWDDFRDANPRGWGNSRSRPCG